MIKMMADMSRDVESGSWTVDEKSAALAVQQLLILTMMNEAANVQTFWFLLLCRSQWSIWCTSHRTHYSTQSHFPAIFQPLWPISQDCQKRRENRLGPTQIECLWCKMIQLKNGCHFRSVCVGGEGMHMRMQLLGRRVLEGSGKARMSHVERQTSLIKHYGYLHQRKGMTCEHSIGWHQP